MLYRLRLPPDSPPGSSALMDLFALMDTGGDGYISEAEVATIELCGRQDWGWRKICARYQVADPG